VFLWKELVVKQTSPPWSTPPIQWPSVSSELNTWNSAWLAFLLSQATSAGGEWPSYLQGLHSLPNSLGFSRVGCCCTKEGWVKSHTALWLPEWLAFWPNTGSRNRRKTSSAEKKAPHPFTSLSTVQTSLVLLSQTHVTPASFQKSIFLLKGNICTLELIATFLLYKSVFFLRYIYIKKNLHALHLCEILLKPYYISQE